MHTKKAEVRSREHTPELAPYLNRGAAVAGEETKDLGSLF
jgi:hypothetical protein